ncbi:hypothetical protein BS78_06G087500 [Paspalum vaginatum]|nr:hypothetical protein BS78_06G087500 [Paspalum vaginatum]
MFGKTSHGAMKSRSRSHAKRRAKSALSAVRFGHLQVVAAAPSSDQWTLTRLPVIHVLRSLGLMHDSHEIRGFLCLVSVRRAHSSHGNKQPSRDRPRHRTRSRAVPCGTMVQFEEEHGTHRAGQFKCPES